MADNVISRFFELGAKEDLDGAFACFAEDGVWNLPESDGNGPGTALEKQAIRDHIEKMNDLSKQVTEQGLEGVFEEPVFLVNGEQAIVEWSLRKIGGDVIERGIDLFTLRDGKILVKDVFRKA
ncbi:nuclear transport factor 2 family protein [Streptomyces sp. NPDC050560]|uniref:nuclear transport factor 2 family protein n=1 Tax=Streptomyces sp. NPDC050560 TaxID=3365630 RepID=UPI003793749C